MASISEQLLGAGASAQNDWAKASAATSLTFTGEAQIRRGIEVAIGISALASADAGLSRFIDATVRGNAFAEAEATLRYQLPLNLFDQFGEIIGVQAVAQAAAGIEVGLSLIVGDFLALLGRNEESPGLPIELVRLLLDEATLGGKFEVHVAAAAMAYASVIIAGQVVKDPGFHVTVDAGLGLAAGVGFSGGLDLGIRDFRKFYGRAVDRTISSILDGVGALPSAGAQALMPRLRALAPVASTALRVAYELGDFITKNLPGTSGHQDAVDLANLCVGTILEEAQRFLFGRFLEAGLRSFEHLVTHDVPNMTSGAWDALRPQRQALANVLYRMPDEPFQPTQDNAAYWSGLISKATELIAKLPAPVGADVTKGMAIVFAATALLTEAIASRVNQAQAYAFAVGAGRVTSPPPPFGGSLSQQPADPIRGHINIVLKRDAAHTIDYADLLSYLVTDVAVAALRAALPDVDEYLAIFQNSAIAKNLTEVLSALLLNRDAFVKNQNGERDPQETLRALLGVLDTFLTIKINQDLVPVINQQLTDGNEKLYFNEVLLGTLLFTKNVAFQTVLDWEKHPVDKAAFTEALAGVMTMLLGRSLVVVGDGFMAVLQAEMQRACAHAAGNLGGPNDPFKAMGIPVSPELKALLADTLRIGGEVFGPLRADTRRSLRFVLYDVMETLPPGAAAQADFLQNLGDQFFIPNSASMEELSSQLLAIARARFQLFVQRVLESGATLLAGAVEDLIQQVIQTVLAWIKQLDGAIQKLADAIASLAQAIQGLLAQAQQAFAQVAQQLDTLLGEFSNQNLRDSLRQNIANNLYQKAKAVLAGDSVYRWLPSDARHFVNGVLKDVISDLVGGSLLDPVFAAISAIAGQLDSVVDDVRELNPNQPLAPQLLDLLIDRMEDHIRDAFGSTPAVHVGFTITVLGFSRHFSLGRIELPFDALFSILRDTIQSLNFYDDKLNAAASALGNAFRQSLDLDARQTDCSNKQTDHSRLSRIRAEFTSDPKTIMILNPVQSLVYDDDVSVQIHLGGVPTSYLGLAKDEQQRVLIFLNGDLIAPQSLALDQPFSSLDSAPLLQPLDVGKLAGFDAARNVIAGSAARISLWRPPQGTAAVAPTSSDAALPLPASIRSLASGRGVASSRPVTRQSVQATGGGSTLVSTALANVLPGRRMTATKRSNLEQNLAPGTAVQFRADRGNLLVGTNTLMVVVIDPGGVRYQQVVSFGVTAPVDLPSSAIPKLPLLPGRASPKPVPAPNQIDLHFNANLIADRLKKGQAFLTQHSVQHLQEFRR